MAPAASARCSSLPACTPTSARSVSPTVPTRSIATRSAVSKSPSTTDFARYQQWKGRLRAAFLVYNRMDDATSDLLRCLPAGDAARGRRSQCLRADDDLGERDVGDYLSRDRSSRRLDDGALEMAVALPQFSRGQSFEHDRRSSPRSS